MDFGDSVLRKLAFSDLRFDLSGKELETIRKNRWLVSIMFSPVSMSSGSRVKEIYTFSLVTKMVYLRSENHLFITWIER